MKNFPQMQPRMQQQRLQRNMAVDLTDLNKAIDDLTVQVSATETVEGSADAAFEGFAAQISKAVTDALTADAAANAGSIAAAKTAISDVTARFKASSDKLGAAIVTSTPGAPPAAAQ